MKKGQIVSALMTCASGTCSRDNCPYRGKIDCNDKMMIDAAECIIRLYKDVNMWAGKVKENEIREAQRRACNTEPVRHGRWVDVNPESPMDPRMRCSVCGHIDLPMQNWRFCPMCSAKMDAEPPKEKDDDQN